VKNPVWLEEEVVLYFHSEQIKAHGGMAGLKLLGQPLRDALTRPQQLNAYRPRTRVFRLAACYGYSIGKVFHPFNDGNKRVAALAAFTFLELNVRFFPKQAFQSRTASSGIGEEQPLEQLQ